MTHTRTTNTRTASRLFVIAGSAVVAAAAVGIGVAQGSPADGTIAGNEMTTGVTVTAETPPSAAPVPAAAPHITGPAPLPLEEQGLPG